MRSAVVREAPSPVVPQMNAPFTPLATSECAWASIAKRFNVPSEFKAVKGAAIKPLSFFGLIAG
jgi:hypothetical protein